MTLKPQPDLKETHRVPRLIKEYIISKFASNIHRPYFGFERIEIMPDIFSDHSEIKSETNDKKMVIKANKYYKSKVTLIFF